jgi:hypothetical protein
MAPVKPMTTEDMPGTPNPAPPPSQPSPQPPAQPKPSAPPQPKP